MREIAHRIRTSDLEFDIIIFKVRLKYMRILEEILDMMRSHFWREYAEKLEIFCVVEEQMQTCIQAEL